MERPKGVPASVGLSVDPLETGWTDWIGTQRRVSARLTEDLSRTLESLGIQIRFGTARFLNPNEVEISDPYGARDRVSGQNIIIATGSRPAFSSVKDSKILNSDQMLKNVEVPAYLLIIGGGYIGCEFASIYRTLGARVTLVEEKDDLLPSWDSVAGDQIWDSLEKQGVTIMLKEKVDLPAPETSPLPPPSCSARDHFEPPIRSRPPVARVHETAIQLDCQRQVRLRQLFPVSLASFDEKHFLLPKFHFHAFRHFVNVIPDPSPNRLILPEHRLSAYRTSGPRTSIPHTTTPEPSALSAPQPADIGPL